MTGLVVEGHEIDPLKQRAGDEEAAALAVRSSTRRVTRRSESSARVPTSRGPRGLHDSRRGRRIDALEEGDHPAIERLRLGEAALALDKSRQSSDVVGDVRVIGAEPAFANVDRAPCERLARRVAAATVARAAPFADDPWYGQRR